MRTQGEPIMSARRINPWAWQDPLGFSQAVAVGDTVFCAGQTAVDADGRPGHTGDMRAQLELAFDNLETVLAQAGLTLGDVVRLNYYTTDVDALFGAYDVITGRLGTARCTPASTLLGVTRLAFPELMVEIEATAMRASGHAA
jgi:enamine deaminase RidA (YjgF/YER057c/UK114 family)